MPTWAQALRRVKPLDQSLRARSYDRRGISAPGRRRFWARQGLARQGILLLTGQQLREPHRANGAYCGDTGMVQWLRRGVWRGSGTDHRCPAVGIPDLGGGSGHGPCSNWSESGRLSPPGTSLGISAWLWPPVLVVGCDPRDHVARGAWDGLVP